MKQRVLYTGQSLLEVLIAIGVAGIILTATAASILSSLSATNQSKDQNLASQYAQEAMDTVRNLRDTDYASFRSRIGRTYCLNANEAVLQTSCPRPNVQNFYRQVQFSTSSECGTSTGIVKVTVVVSWQDTRCTNAANPYCHNVTLSNCFSDFNKVPTP